MTDHLVDVTVRDGLALTHVSNRYGGREVEEEARQLFAETIVPRDFDVVDVPFPERGPPVLVPRGAKRGRGEVGST